MRIENSTVWYGEETKAQLRVFLTPWLFCVLGKADVHGKEGLLAVCVFPWELTDSEEQNKGVFLSAHSHTFPCSWDYGTED